MAAPTPTSGTFGGIASPNLSGYDLSDHTSYGGRLNVITILLLCVVTISVTLRSCLRLLVVRKMWVDDYLLILAAVVHIVFSALMLYGVQLGFGRHIWDVAPLASIFDRIKSSIQDLFILQILYATGISLAKLSIMACYLRIFPHTYLTWITSVTGSVVAALWICTVFVTIFQCNPLQAVWDFDVSSAICIDFIDYLYVAGAINGVTDLLLVFAPLPLIYRLQISRKEKTIISCLFGLGFFASTAAFIRLSHLHELGSVDVTQSITRTLQWTNIELGIGIFCPCAPSFKPLLTRFLPSKPAPNLSATHSVPASRRYRLQKQGTEGFELVSKDRAGAEQVGKTPRGYTTEVTADVGK